MPRKCNATLRQQPAQHIRRDKLILEFVFPNLRIYKCLSSDFSQQLRSTTISTNQFHPMYILQSFLPFLGILVEIALGSPRNLQTIASVKRTTSETKASYDYIIIGGGQSGLTVADRLTEDPTSISFIISPYFLPGSETYQ